ncbi:MAG: energy transducer TonB [Acidobacteria bacterium]|nr:MAG: energy transducer TonB [Acidobacteriota bacterium]
MRKQLIGLLWVSILIGAASTALAQNPLTADEAETLVTNSTNSKKVIKVIQDRGVGFTVSRNYIENLKRKGVKENVLAALCVAATGPLSKDQLIVLLKSGMPDESLAALVKNRRLTFKPSDDDLDEFRGLGAGDQLATALQNSQWIIETLSNRKLIPGTAAAAHPGPYQDSAGSKVDPPVPVYHPSPQYTKEARQARISGNVSMNIVVNEKGEVTDATVVRGLGYGLDESALRAVKSWKFKPARRDGTPIAAKVTVEVSFVLDAQDLPGIQQ